MPPTRTSRLLPASVAGLAVAGLGSLGLAAAALPASAAGYIPAGPTNMTSCSGLAHSQTCAWPGASNTGVPAGTALTTLTAANVPAPAGCHGNSLSGGTLTITCPGTVVDSYDIEEINVFVSAPGVVFSRDLIQTHSYGQQDANVVLVDWSNPSAHLALYDSTLNGYGWQGNNYHVIAYGQYTAIRDNVYGGTDADAYVNGGTLIEDSWFHDAYACEAYQNPTGPGSDCGIHADVLQKSEGSHDAVIHTTIQSSHGTLTSGIQCCTDQGSVSDWKVEGNLFLTDGWQMYGGYPGQNSLSGAVYTGNHFTGRIPAEKGPVVYASGPGITFSANVLDHSGLPVGN